VLPVARENQIGTGENVFIFVKYFIAEKLTSGEWTEQLQTGGR